MPDEQREQGTGLIGQNNADGLDGANGSNEDPEQADQSQGLDEVNDLV